jgi:subtilisin family serine protease
MSNPATPNGHSRSSLAVLAWFLAMAILVATVTADAGVVNPDLEKRLGTKAAGELVAVIVELEERANPSGAASSAPARDRRARGRAVVQALRDTAERTQGPIRALIAQEEAQGEASGVRSFWVFNGLALNASEKTIRKLAARHDVREVRFDKPIPEPKPRPRKAATLKSAGAPPAWNLEQIRAPQVWDFGHTGAGIVVGSFDTGVDGTHPDLVPNYRGNDAISWFDPYNEHDSPYDNNGHGTHTTGTMVASGESSGFRVGVAPGARWIAAKGWTDDGDATASAFHSIFEWFLAPGGDPANAPDVVNSSWGMDPPSCDPEFVADVQAFRAAGIVPVFASGNSGPDPSTTLAPGSYATAFSVGATDFVDDIAEFSSQGPSQCDGAVKPDVSAPGVAILSTLPGAFHFELDGTSMAAPHVSGAAAVLRSIDPGLTVEEIEAAIVDGAVDQGPVGPDNAFGAGRLDLAQSASLVLGIPLVGIEATAAASEAGLVPGRFTVRRKGSTVAELVVPYTVAGTAAPGGDYVALPGSVTIPAGASSAVIDVTPFDDALAELTETVVATLTPNSAYLAAPAQATVNITSDEALPDLAVSSLTAPSAGGADSPVTLTETTRNQGPGASEASATGFYISSNSTLDAGDTLIGARTVPALAPGASSAASVTVTLPAGLAPGPWYLLAKADHADLLAEGQEGNNVAARGLLVGPDLNVSVLTAPAIGGAGLAIALGDTTRNSGGGTSPASTTTYYLSADPIHDPSDTLLASRAVPSLVAGATHAGNVSATVPAATAPGTYYVIARADAASAVPEANEFNNAYFRALRIGPDLIVTAFNAPDVAGAGVPVTSGATRTPGRRRAPRRPTTCRPTRRSMLPTRCSAHAALRRSGRGRRRPAPPSSRFPPAPPRGPGT